MSIANAKSNPFLLVAMFVGLVNASSLSAAETSWKDETVLISSKGGQTVVRPFEGDKVLFKFASNVLSANDRRRSLT